MSVIIVTEIFKRSELMSLIKALREGGETGKVRKLEKLLQQSYTQHKTKIEVPTDLVD